MSEPTETKPPAPRKPQRPPTSKQQAILDFIESQPMVPTIREIGKRFGIKSTNGVVAHLKALERKGLIDRERKLSRGIHRSEDGLADLLRDVEAALPLDREALRRRVALARARMAPKEGP